MNERAKKFTDLVVGDEYSFVVSIGANLVDAFARLSGDENPLHTDDAYAAATPFKKRIPHGMIAGMLFSRLVGMHLPGRYSVYAAQSLYFHKPMELGADVIVRGVLSQKSEATRTIHITTELLDKGSGTCLVSGEALVKLFQ